MSKTRIGILVVLAACGGSGTDSDGGTDASLSDAPGDSFSGADAAKDTAPQDTAADNGNDVIGADSAEDAPVDAPGFDGPLPFACGPKTCLPSQYCTVSHGLVSLDGGVYTGYQCTALPSKCYPTPSCSCVSTVGPCSCVDSAGDITVTCSF
jgi:hypothetical protein